jgi:hypothetical protein
MPEAAAPRGPTLRYTEAAVATLERPQPTTLDEAGGVQAQGGLGDLMASAEPWEGESLEELIRILREGRDAGGTAERPKSL